MACKGNGRKCDIGSKGHVTIEMSSNMTLQLFSMI